MGFVVDVTANCVRVESHAEPLTLPTLPGDWSSLGYLLLCAWRSGGVVALVDREAAHPDAFMLDVLAQAGLQVIDDVDGTHVTGSATSGVRASGAVCPDLLPTVAALACVLPQPSTLHAVSILRDKESDRLRGIEELVHAAGGRTSLHDDTLTIVPGTVPAHLVLQSHHDHRMAMAAATLAVLSGATLELDDVTCVAKSFPQFFAELHKLGVVLTTL
jgi:3-phosphoshikimate 1-carboxyvinyltransferase